MPIEFLCPGCNRQLRVPDTAAGKQAKCPSCEQVCSIPVQSASVASAPAASLAPTTGSSTATDHLKETSYFPNPQRSDNAGSSMANPFAAPTPAAGVANVETGGQFEMATRLSRFGGRFIDLVLMVLGGGVVAGLLAILIANLIDENIAGFAASIGMWAGIFMVSVVNWILIVKTGQTMGKKMVGTKIVMEQTGQIPDFVQGVLLRSVLIFIVGAVFSPFKLVDWCWIFGENRQCLHDLVAKTRVVRV